MRKWMLTALASCAVLAAQAPQPTDVFEKAPPEIDNALRERVAKFFQAHISGKYRLAEEVVAEDSKDQFYNMEKQHYLGYEIIRINYSDNFSKATVVTGVEVEWRSPRVGILRVKPPLTSLWKIDNGKWCWYVVPQKDWETPWGRMHPGPDNPDNTEQLKRMFTGVDVATVKSQVAIDKKELRLSGYQASQAEATIVNSMPGEIKLRLEAPPLKGLQVKLDKESLKNGEYAKVSAQYTPATTEPKATSEILVHVEPTGQMMRLALVFDIQPELRKQLPKELQK